MRLIDTLWKSSLAALLNTALFGSLARARGSIDATVHASFPAPPLLVELLEAAAEENATSYFPLISTIAAGHFQDCTSDEELYRKFVQVIESDGHLSNAVALSSFKLGVALHAAAPRIEAHYQFYRTSVQSFEHDTGFLSEPLSVWLPAAQACLSLSCAQTKTVGVADGQHHTARHLQIDRYSMSQVPGAAWTLYADISSPGFAAAYLNWRAANEAKHIPSIRIRYRPSISTSHTPLVVNGYGVELALKRTDYIVIDDRQAEIQQGQPALEEGNTNFPLESETRSDLAPLSSSELFDLGLKSASYIMGSANPLDTLLRISRDFPMYAAQLASHNISNAFLNEHYENRERLLPAGTNVIWINGVMVGPRDMDAFSLLDQLRRERKLINGFQKLGFSASESIALLSHDRLIEAQSDSTPQRYDYRDLNEGGKVIIWLNDLENDKRYAEWPTNVNVLLQRTYPGQLPQIAKDMHQVILPIRLDDRQDLRTVVENLQLLVKRGIAVRFGIVPLGAQGFVMEKNAQLIYHLHEVFGLATVIDYLRELSLEKILGPASKQGFIKVTEGRKVRRGCEAVSFEEAISSEVHLERASAALKYASRLGAVGPKPPIFANGVAISRTEDWMQTTSQRLSVDLRLVQAGISEGQLVQDTWIPSIWLNDASFRRNSLIIPEDDKDVRIFDVGELSKQCTAVFIDSVTKGRTEDSNTFLSVVIITDTTTSRGAGLALVARELVVEGVLQDISVLETQEVGTCVTALGFHAGQYGVLVNGRLVGPLKDTSSLSKDDLRTLFAYENRKRIQPVIAAAEALSITDKITSSLAIAKLTSLVAISSKTDIPEGVYDTSPGPRTSVFNRLEASHTCIETGSGNSSEIQIVASVDPSSEIAQRWIPIIRTLSEMAGVNVRVFLNPREALREFPIKRFYRYVLQSSPRFQLDGSIGAEPARFERIPEDLLLTMTMDVPPSWLVAPSESIHDLDNIKMSSVKGDDGIEAVYKLEHILIEGHSRDASSNGSPPRGAQLVLQTGGQSDVDGTIVMANLGYFQFKANPGVFNIALQEGRSQEIFTLDSVGALGWTAQNGTSSSEICLHSFKGATVFPRFSRRLGQEIEDVLVASTSASSLISGGANHIDQLLERAGFGAVKISRHVVMGLHYGQKLLSKAGIRNALTSVEMTKHAEINIFSVASGHLYERMLNIMMVSVMRHTRSSVKFWFIEQFLSPSFKSFLPTLAAEYGFHYELVTYKWPHWLRAQKEKQRVIWGYKILFLDVLFPLDLNKVIFVDADQIVRTDMLDLINHNLHGAPYGFTPMCDSREEMEGFRFWKQGYWKNFLRGLPYHISALYVVDLNKFRQIAAGDRLRQQYHQLSADPESLSNLDQDLPNHMQNLLPIHSLPQEWLWCETWCSDEALKEARTIDLCNNPLTKEPKLERARRQVPEWTTYDDEIALLASRVKATEGTILGQGDSEGMKTDKERTAYPAKDEL